MWQFVLILAVIYFFFRWKGAESLLQSINNEPRVHPKNEKNSQQGTRSKDEKKDYIDYEEID